MFDNFKPTKAETAAINKAFRSLYQFARSEWALDELAKQESRGQAKSRADRVPLIAARGLLVKWFLEGANAPDTQLREWFDCRPVAIYMAGLGAAIGAGGQLTPELVGVLDAGSSAYDDAFRRMLDTNKAELVKAYPDALK